MLLLAVALAGCGQLEVGIEVTATVVPAHTMTQAVAVATVQPTTVPTFTAMAIAPTLASSATAAPSPTFTPAPPAPVNTAVASPSPTAAPLPAIHRLSVSPQTVAPGAQLQLNWEANGSTAEICLFQDGYAEYEACRDTAVSGALTWQLDDALRDDIIVELSVRRGEQTATETAAVTVTCAASEAWWFFSPAPTACPAAEAVTTQAATQPFEHGWMLWLEAEDVIYAFFDDNTYAQFGGDQLEGNEDAGDGGVPVPEGLVAPIRGFGLVWRGETEGLDSRWVGEKLGWGLLPEFGFQTQYQRDLHTNASSLYVRDADGRIIHLNPTSSSWTVYRGLE